MDIPKTYAEIIKSSFPKSTSKNTKIDIKTQRRIQLEALRKDRLKSSITISIKDAPFTSQNAIMEMSGKDIAERCQRAINAVRPTSGPSMILGISKLSKAFRIQFEREEHVEQIRSYAKSPGIDWDKAFDVKLPANGTGIRMHTPTYGIVVHGERNDRL